MSSGGRLAGQVCLVTGASRGLGKGIALQLSEAGATVYITARHREQLLRAAEEVSARGGRCVPVVCDSSREEEVAALFERLQQAEGGRLDVLVANAFSGVDAIGAQRGLPFWESPAALWDLINNAGLRGHYFCARYAARLMVPAGHGLIVFISSPGGLRYMFNVPYGVGKAACDRLAADCAVELRPYSVACVTLWPGLVRTEAVLKEAEGSGSGSWDEVLQKMIGNSESPEVSGKCVVGLASDPAIMCLSGKVLLTPDLARRYRFRDVDGKPVYNYVSVRNILMMLMPGLTCLFRLIPECVSIPKWALTLYSSKFSVYPPLQPALKPGKNV
ncbi:dehydrogenase/reductase SDR family member 1 [Gopherus evgoodei]|uniref:dehydrogenase/reductase SDR family member 1 n=1 Tax=Gopherus evgoodei TaxID=1825980 RepID=UPI0011D03268|nr:dehydrogenase/reductase SDR family member 1 [Gopherus evgoodei]